MNNGARSLLQRIAIAALPLWVVVAALVFNIDWRIKVVVASVLVTTLAAPDKGLLLAAVLAPLAYLLGELIQSADFRLAEAIVLAFLTGWLARAARDPSGPTVPGALTAALFAVAIVASVAGSAWKLGVPGEVGRVWRDVFFMYFYMTERIGLVEGARLLEGLGLVAATVHLFRRRPALAMQLPAALVASGVAAALASVALWFGIGFPADVERFQRIGYRISAHVLDVNAGGSYFAMLWCVALGMLLRSHGRRRVAWVAAAAAIGMGLWLSFSQAALAAAAICCAVAVAFALTRRWTTTARVAAIVGVLAVTLAIGAMRAWQLMEIPEYRGTGLRQQFIETSLRMIQARPVSGIGIGQYYALSPLLLTPELAWTYGHENAHNYFLQIAVELGIVGFALFVVWLAAIARRVGQAVKTEPRDWRLLGCAAGVSAFLATSLTGHPLLVAEVAYPFWMVLALSAALAGSTALNAKGAVSQDRHRPNPLRAWSAAAATALAMFVPFVASAPLQPSRSQAVVGFYDPEQADDGTRYRWSEGYASLFVPAGVREISLDLRVPTRTPAVAPMSVEFRSGGRDLASPFVTDEWTTVSFPLPDPDPRLRFTRVDLKVGRTWQPAVYIAGSADMRHVGVQVGAQGFDF